jgi:phenylalanyl-tRNA synthetase beta chain
MKISRTWLQKYFDAELPPTEKLAELFTFHAFEIEGIEKAGEDDVLDLKVLPDRAHYALSYRGIARELSAIASLPLRPLEVKEVSEGASATPSITVTDYVLCRRYVGRIAESVSITESPMWLKTALEAAGSRSINTIVDATNYVMLDIGQPLHAFDADKVKGGICVRLAKEGERITTLDGKDIDLLPGELVIADDFGPLAIAGVKGGKRAEVTAETTRIIIESANFEPTSVRRTSARVKIKNDSSKRFENELTPHTALEAMHAVSALIQELSPAAKFGPVVDRYEALPAPRSIEISAASISERLGYAVALDDAIAALKRLSIGVANKGGVLALSIPHDRLDLVIPEDIVEEVGRLLGYDKVPALVPAAEKSAAVHPAFYWAERVKSVLVAAGFSEVSTYALVPKGHYEVAYPLASDKQALRANLAEGITKSLALNASNADLLGLEAIKVFEIGTVFGKDAETFSLSVGALQAKKRKGVTAEGYLTQALAVLAADLGVEISATPVAAGAGALVELDFSALVEKLSKPASYADLSFTKAPKVAYKPFSAYPYIVRDIALFVPAGTDEALVLEVLRAAATASGLLEKGPDRFDRFEKDGRISLAYRLIFQSHQRTLTDTEVNTAMGAVYAAAKEKGWEVR